MITKNLKQQIILQFEEDAWLQVMLKKDWRDLANQCVAATFHKVHWKQNSEVTFVFVNDQAIQQLNAKYRHKNVPTNVLSFPLLNFIKPCHCQEKDDSMLGDIVLSFETVLKESQDYHISFLNHTFHLMTHGMLHLLGYDHENQTDASAMELLEISILSDFDIPNPYVAYE